MTQECVVTTACKPSCQGTCAQTESTPGGVYLGWRMCAGGQSECVWDMGGPACAGVGVRPSACGRMWESAWVHTCVCVGGVHGRIRGHVECVGPCGLACSAQGPLPAFDGELDSRLLAGLPCGIYFCLSADQRPE